MNLIHRLHPDLLVERGELLLKLTHIRVRQRLQLPFAKVGHKVAFNDADIVIQRRFLALRVNLLPQSSTANSGNLCDRVCAVC